MKVAVQFIPLKNRDVVEDTHSGWRTPQHLELSEICAEFVAKAAEFEAAQSSPEEAAKQLKTFASYVAAEYGG